jgi:hypothetical protein
MSSDPSYPPRQQPPYPSGAPRSAGLLVVAGMAGGILLTLVVILGIQLLRVESRLDALQNNIQGRAVPAGPYVSAPAPMAETPTAPTRRLAAEPAPAAPAQETHPEPLVLAPEPLERVRPAPAPVLPQEDAPSGENIETTAAETPKKLPEESSGATLARQDASSGPDAAPAEAPAARESDLQHTGASRPPQQDVPGTATPTGRAQPAAGGLRGRLLSVQDATVMLALGASDGVDEGDRFSIWRGGLWIGELRATNVHADMTTCEVVFRGSGGIRVSDLAIELQRNEHDLPESGGMRVRTD